MPDLPSFGHNRSTTITGVLKPLDTLGRFELRKVLGKGAQSTVWLAFDPRL